MPMILKDLDLQRSQMFSDDLAEARKHVEYLESLERQKGIIDTLTPEEGFFVEWASRNGLLVLRNGWPDFMLVNERGNACSAVEIKAAGDKLRPEQSRMHFALSAIGLTIHVGSANKVASDLRERVRYGGSPLEDKEQFHGRMMNLMGRQSDD